MQGQTFDPVSRKWRTKNPKKSPDPRDREKLLAKIVEETTKPVPVESKGFDWTRYRPTPGRVLLRVGAPVAVDGLHIPDAAQWSEQAFVVVAIGWLRIGSLKNAPFKVGDRVILDRNSHQRPMDVGDAAKYVLVKIRRVAAVLTA